MSPCDLIVTGGELFLAGGIRPEASDTSWSVLSDGAIAIQGERIVAVGESREIDASWKAATRLDAAGRLVTPGLIDPHTHLLFGGWRAEEFAARVSGQPLEKTLRKGIGATVEATRSASDDALSETLRARLGHWLRHGVTTVEIKSGYGLSVEAELRMLELIDGARATFPGEIVSTVLAAHAVPHDFDGSPGEYLERVAVPVAERAREAGLAEYVDVFVEDGAFGVDESEAYLRRAVSLGYRLRVHGDQLGPRGRRGLGGASRCDQRRSSRARRGRGRTSTHR